MRFVANRLNHGRKGATARACVELSTREAEALDAAADYLIGFGRVLQVLDDERYPGSDVREVVGTLRELYSRSVASPRAA